MRPLSNHTDHLCWQQRVNKERGVIKDFYRYRSCRTFGGLTVPREQIPTFQEYFPIRKPISFRNVSPDWLESFSPKRNKPDNFGSTILGTRYREVRGKYSRPVEALNGLVRLKTVQEQHRGRGKQIDFKAKTTGFVTQQSLEVEKQGETRDSESPMSPTKPLSASMSPRKLPKEYIEQLKAQLEAEKQVPAIQKRAEIESRISNLRSAGKS